MDLLCRFQNKLRDLGKLLSFLDLNLMATAKKGKQGFDLKQKKIYI